MFCRYAERCPSVKPSFLSDTAYSALMAHRRCVQNLIRWDKENPPPPFERAQETHKVERLAESMKVAEAAERVIDELERDVVGR